MRIETSSPVGFKFGLQRSPGVAFFCNEANIRYDSWRSNSTYLFERYSTPGDKIQFGDLNLRFLVDEDFDLSMEIQNWIRGLGYPEETKEFNDLTKEGVLNDGKAYSYKQSGDDIYSDGTFKF